MAICVCGQHRLGGRGRYSVNMFFPFPRLLLSFVLGREARDRHPQDGCGNLVTDLRYRSFRVQGLMD